MNPNRENSDRRFDLAFAGGRIVHIEAGDSLCIPGGTPHNEVATSGAFELLEVSVPADLGTKPCDPPDALDSDHAGTGLSK